MPHGWKVTIPKDDSEYFERMTKCIFTAGLNWSVVEKKWPNFRRAFAEFLPSKVSRFSGSETRTLMKDSGIVRNERKIAATTYNAGQFLNLQKEFGSFRKYLDSFGKNEKRLLDDIQDRFQHLGASTARMFLWSAGYELKPTAEEKKWMAKNQ
ncbi:MAG: DNA-3-methyladenine glycosylase I [Thaumarchaeota archaeon]|nr:DNA-3-methyladenine glycosylase I [Nitrososphaerota archaeon]MCS4539482.1 DNA-3-methyladenine glycosylase I [Nitrososphaerota archaeon]